MRTHTTAATCMTCAVRVFVNDWMENFGEKLEKNKGKQLFMVDLLRCMFGLECANSNYRIPSRSFDWTLLLIEYDSVNERMNVYAYVHVCACVRSQCPCVCVHKPTIYVNAASKPQPTTIETIEMGWSVGWLSRLFTSVKYIPST